MKDIFFISCKAISFTSSMDTIGFLGISQFIEEVSVQRTNNIDLEELQSQLTINGFIKIMEEEKAKAI